MKTLLVILCSSFILVLPTAKGEVPAPVVHTVEVRSGDTLSKIASRHRTTVEALMKLNHLSNPDRLYAGQRLKVPVSSPPAQPSQAPGQPSQAPAKSEQAKAKVAATDDAPSSNQERVKAASKPQVTVSSAVSASSPVSARGVSVEKAERPSQRRTAEKHILLKHWVREGETVKEIAEVYGVAPEAIIETNGIRRPSEVPSGMVLWIPKHRTRAPQVRAMRYLNGLSSERVVVKHNGTRQTAGSAPKRKESRRLAKPQRQKRLGATINP